MAVQKAFNGKISFGVESTPGTEVARSATMRLTSTNLQAKLNSDRVPHLVGSAGSTRANRDRFATSIDVAGDIEAPACYSGGCLGLLLEAALGTVATVGGSAPYTHTFTVGSSQLSLSAAVERGVGGLGDEEFYGLKVNTLELSVSPGQPMTVKAGLIGMSSGARGSDSPPALATAKWILHSHAGTLSFNSVNYTIASFTFRLNNALARLDELGSLYSSEPEPTDFQTFEMEVEMVARSDALYAAHQARTASDAVVAFTLDSNYAITFTLQNAEITTYEDPLSGPGVIRQRMTFTGVGDDTKHGVSIALKNESSSSRSA